MDRKAVSGILLTLLFIGMLTLAFNVQPVRASETIYIRADGSVYPDTAPISAVDNIIYILTDNIVGDVPEETSAVVVERDNIVVDGAGYTVQGLAVGYGIGMYLPYRNNVTLKNVEVTNFDYGIYLDYSNNNTLTGNTASNNVYGIYLDYSNNNVLSGNTASHNWDYGIFLCYSRFDSLFHNNLINNGIQARVYPSGYVNTWDDGYPSSGNYWSDYSLEYPSVVDDYHGENQDIPGGDGIWDSPYVIDGNNQDNYPFVNPWFLDTIPPVADAGPDQTVYEDTPVTFNGSGSSDNVGIASYIWTFVDVTPQTLTGITPTYTFTTPGIYTVTLNVSDAAGNHATDTVTITVLRLTPEVLTQRLIATIETWNLGKGTEKSLTSKLEEALHLLAMGNENGAIHKLMDLIMQVEALREGKLTNEQADQLIAETQRIIDLIEG